MRKLKNAAGTIAFVAILALGILVACRKDTQLARVGGDGSRIVSHRRLSPARIQPVSPVPTATAGIPTLAQIIPPGKADYRADIDDRRVDATATTKIAADTATVVVRAAAGDVLGYETLIVKDGWICRSSYNGNSIQPPLPLFPADPAAKLPDGWVSLQNTVDGKTLTSRRRVRRNGERFIIDVEIDGLPGHPESAVRVMQLWKPGDGLQATAAEILGHKLVITRTPERID